MRMHVGWWVDKMGMGMHMGWWVAKRTHQCMGMDMQMCTR